MEFTVDITLLCPLDQAADPESGDNREPITSKKVCFGGSKEMMQSYLTLARGLCKD